VAQWLPVDTGRGMQLPAYSGGTAWDSHPLRETAGQSRRVIRQLDVNCLASITCAPWAGC